MRVGEMLALHNKNIWRTSIMTNKEHSIIMRYFYKKKISSEDDIVNFELGAGNDGREQAINVTPILTQKMIEDSLKEDNLFVRNMKDAFGNRAYLVVDQNNVIQSSEYGMSFLELAKYAGFDIVQASA